MNNMNNIDLYLENKRIYKVISINLNEVGMLEETCNGKSCNFVHIKKKNGNDIEFIGRVNNIEKNNIKKHGNTIVFKSYGLDEKVIYNVNLGKSIRVTNAKYNGIKNEYECYIDTYTDDTKDRAYFKLNADNMKTNGFYSENQGIFIPLYSENEYKDDDFYNSLDSYNKYLKRMKDTFKDKISAKLAQKYIEEDKCLIKRIKAC